MNFTGRACSFQLIREYLLQLIDTFVGKFCFGMIWDDGSQDLPRIAYFVALNHRLCLPCFRLVVTMTLSPALIVMSHISIAVVNLLEAMSLLPVDAQLKQNMVTWVVVVVYVINLFSHFGVENHDTPALNKEKPKIIDFHVSQQMVMAAQGVGCSILALIYNKGVSHIVLP